MARKPRRQGPSPHRGDLTSIPRSGMPFTGTGPNISNVVAGMDLNCRFDLTHVSQSARNAVYNPKRFPACVVRIRDPKATALIFAGGRMQVLGTKSVEDCRLAGRKFARMLQKIGYQPRLTDLNVQNIVGNADANMLIRLEGLQLHLAPAACWAPELFPGLIFKMMKPKMTILVFAKGKMVFLGAKSKEELDEALGLMWPVLLEHRITGS